MQQGLSEPECNGDLVYKFRKIVGKTEFSDQFKKIIMRYNVMGYNVDVLRQSACLVRNISHIFQQKCFDINSAEHLTDLFLTQGLAFALCSEAADASSSAVGQNTPMNYFIWSPSPSYFVNNFKHFLLELLIDQQEINYDYIS